jgi:hypothetical protein
MATITITIENVPDGSFADAVEQIAKDATMDIPLADIRLDYRRLPLDQFITIVSKAATEYVIQNHPAWRSL